MAGTNRREWVKTLATAAGAGAIGCLAPRAAEAQGSAGALDETRAQAIIAGLKPAVVLLEVEREVFTAWGSGFFVSSDGLLITNRHVVKDGVKITCIYRNRDRLPARVLKVDPQYDLAIVKVDVKGPVPTVTLGDSDTLPDGLLVSATGYPRPKDIVFLGMALDSSTSRGALNGLRYGGDSNTFLGDRALQIDAPVAPGNSGGPVTRLDTGEVIGVVAAGYAQDNLTFAVPINQAKVLLAGAGLQPKPAPAAGNSPDAATEPGDLRTLNTISATKELPRLFGYGFPFARNYEPNRGPKDDWRAATGQVPADVTPLTLAGDDLLFGASDGRLRRWDLQNMAEAPAVLLHVGDHMIFVDAPMASKDIIVAAAGSLDLTMRFEERVTLASGLSALFGGSATQTKRIVRIEGNGTLVGLNRRNGNIEWAVDTGWVGSPTLAGNLVFYGGVGERGCVDVTQGKKLWSTGVKKGPQGEYYQIGHATEKAVLGLVVPVEGKDLDNGPLVILGDGKARVEAWDPATGKVLWKREIGDVSRRHNPLGAAIVYDQGKNVVYALAAQVVAAVSAADGKLLWAYDHAKAMAEALKKSKDRVIPRLNFSPQIAIHEGVLYLGSEDRRLYAFNGEDGKVLWTYNTRGFVGHPAYHDGTILVGTTDGYLHVVDARSGALIWRVQTSSPVVSRPLVHRGLVFAPTGEGSIETIRIPVA